MLLSDLLYYANQRLSILKHSIVEFRIFLAPDDFKNIWEQCQLLKSSNIKYRCNTDNNCIIFKDYTIFQQHFASYQHPNVKLNNGIALFEYDFSNYWEQKVEILTKEEKIIKDIIE